MTIRGSAAACAAVVLFACGAQPRVDAGTPVDSGTLDAGPMDDGGAFDAGPGDGGAVFDGGGLVDGGGLETDGGSMSDGGTDAGLPDAGLAGGCPGSPAWNLARNGGFECDGGSLAPWVVGAGTGQLVPGRDGGWAVRLTVGAGGSVVLSTSMPLVSAPPPPARFCARAWVRGSTGTARLEAFRFPVGQADTFSEPLLGVDWQVVPPSSPLSSVVTAADSVYLRLQLLNASPGATVDVDDLRAWVSTSAQCPEPQ